MLARIPAKAAPELEIKFQLGAGALEVLEREGFPSSQDVASRMGAVYYDTPAYALRDAGFSLRVRRSGEVHTQTLKHRAGGGLFQRDEWEVETPGFDLDRQALADTPAAAAVGESPLVPVFTVEVERRTHIRASGDARIEVSLDTGVVAAGARHDRIAELELELLSGSPQELFALARELQGQADLTLLFESKAERGYRLIGHDGVAALKAQGSAVGPETDGAGAFQAIAREALVQIAGNARLLQRAHNPDVLHQLRVGLRRLRAALSAFRPMLDAEGLGRARAETRWLAGEVAEARDIDVFLERARAPDEIEENAGRAAFFRALRVAQAEAYERALAAVRSDRFRALLLDTAEWIEAGLWLHVANGEQRALREGRAADLAATVLDRLHRKVGRRSRRFLRLDQTARHELRKQAKKLRYAAAFFGQAFPDHPKRRARYSAALRLVQDRLGESNDIAVARDVALRAVGTRPGEIAFAAGIEVGCLTAAETELLASADAALKALRDRQPFWSHAKHRKDRNNSELRLRSA